MIDPEREKEIIRLLKAISDKVTYILFIAALIAGMLIKEFAIK